MLLGLGWASLTAFLSILMLLTFPFLVLLFRLVLSRLLLVMISFGLTVFSLRKFVDHLANSFLCIAHNLEFRAFNLSRAPSVG